MERDVRAAGSKLVNRVYNSDFRLAQEDRPDFPDGWIPVGGDEATTWEWAGVAPGPRRVVIRHPSGPPAGVVQALEVAVPAGEMQRWKVKVTMEAEPPGTPCYLRIYFGTLAGFVSGIREFQLLPRAEPESFTRVVTTPAGTGALRLEPGITGSGTLAVHLVEAYLLYPRRALRLDERGRVFVRHVNTVGEILKPVRLAGPVKVSVQAAVTADIRNLTPDRDGVRIYGSAAAPLATTADGLARVQVAERAFVDSRESVLATAVPAAAFSRDVSGVRLFSFAVFNPGAAAAVVRLEISPDGVHWAADTPDQEVVPGALLVLVPRFFLRYARVVYWAASPTPLIVWFQAQS